MIDDEVKIKLLQELEKDGNVYRACAKVGISKATYYRWFKTDEKFRKESKAAVKNGRENICDIAEHALMSKVKEKDMNAIKYLLAHNSKIYKPKTTTKVILEHTRKLRPSDLPPAPTLEDFLDDLQKLDDENEPNSSP